MAAVASPALPSFAVPASPPPALRLDDPIWPEIVQIRQNNRVIPVALTNFAGRNYPTLNDSLMTTLLDIAPTDRVLDIGGGDAPFSRANVVTNVLSESGARRSNPALDPSGRGAQEFVACVAGELPFEDGAFDFAVWRAVLEHVADPAAACREMMRVAKRGFIETLSPLAEYLGGDPAHRWIVSVERLPDEEPTLIFRRKPFVRAPFRYCLRPHRLHNDDFRVRWEWQYRNLTHTQFAWEGAFRFRVEEDAAGLNYDDPKQAAEAHLDAAINALRFGVPAEIALQDAERACALRPDWGLAHNVRGCALWTPGREREALVAFTQAARLEPKRSEYRANMNLRPGDRTACPNLVLLPADREDGEWIESNFAGKVYYAFVGFDDRLAQDLNIGEGERVLDVGGGQRPLRRADVSVDFDVFEGLHRQGQAISRDRPLVCGDAQNLPFRDHAFDVACCRMVLEHVADPARACRELQRVAKRGFLETPNTFWEAFYGHPTHRWLIEWEAATRTLVFKRKPFDAIPFKSALVPFLYTQPDIQRAFEITFRNITTTQITWDEEHPFSTRVEDDRACPYDYLARPEDATRGSLNYARDLLEGGLPAVAIAECEDALRVAPTPALRRESLLLRLRIAEAMRDVITARDIRARLQSAECRVMRDEARPASLSLKTQENAPVQKLTSGSALSAQRSALVWTAPLRDPSGYADEARHFLFALERAGVPVAARNIAWSKKVAALSGERERQLQTMLGRFVSSDAIHVSHILAPMMTRSPQARANVGRTMFETDRLPTGWAKACNAMDAVWVPGEFNRETFAFAGVERDKLRVVPGAIDLTPYHPNIAPLSISGARGYNFVSVFDWTLRKGWDVLIRAFVEEFGNGEDVALILKTHSSLGYTVERIVEQVSDYLVNVLGRDPNRIPDIVFQDSNVPDARMPNLYRAGDCYVMPTRGEGWGRPLMEAMSLGLPAIATNWSGPTAFMTSDNSLLLDYELTDVPEIAWRETPTYQGHRWAEPSLPHLRAQMRFVFENRDAAREIGQRGRAHIEQNFSYMAVARIIASELERL